MSCQLQVINTNKREIALNELHTNHDLLLRLKIYHYDLMHFNKGKSNMRLSTTHHSFSMSDCYFNDHERQFLLNFPTSDEQNLQTRLNTHINNKLNSSENTIICTSHDIAPIIQEIFVIKKGYELEKEFIKELKRFNKKNFE